ncbi:MAG: HepT-like ribonuclease domain-containing protein [Fimbriimonadales bacterium]
MSDILSAGANIQQFVAEVSFEDYIASTLLRSAVERQFEIIGEALARLSRHNPDVFAQIPNARRIIDFRNVLAHGYDVIDHEIVWQAIHEHLPQLLSVIRSMLDDFERGRVSGSQET